jgi:hypothetical protein
MKMLVIFEKSPQAALNLRLALEMARLTWKAVGHKPELLVCVMELLREDRPLDDYLAEMERATEDALARIDDILDQAGDNLRPNVRVKVVRGMELEAAELVAYQAREFQAEIIQLSVNRACAACQQHQHQQKSGWPGKIFKRKSLPAAPAPVQDLYPPRPVSLNTLARLTACRINVTCHGEKLFTLYVHNSEINSRKIGQ